jgi:hypothetical protein
MLFRNASASQQPEHFGTSFENRKKKDLKLRFLGPDDPNLDGKVGAGGR